MNRRSMLLAGALVALGAPAFAAESDPVAVVRELYRVHGEYEKTKQQAWQPPHRARFFTRALGAAIARAHRQNRIDYDFIYDGQDYQISELSIRAGRMAGGRATVTATFKNFKEPKHLEYELVRERGAWRIADIRSREKPAWTLTKVLAGP